jgi:hypothetical protein
MAKQRIACSGRESTTPLDRIGQRIEAEIHRLRVRRPALSDRLDRATKILVLHLACPRSRVVRVRIGADGQARFLVKSTSEGGVVYAINPRDWTCSCPDHHRRGGVCKHALACWILWRVARPRVPRRRTCDGCQRRFPRGELVELHPENHDGLAFFDGDLLCTECADGAGVLR